MSSKNPYTVPAAPVITDYADGVVSGTEATADTIISVFNVTDGYNSISSGQATVVDGQWSLVADLPPAKGDSLVAVAIYVGGGSPGAATSSAPYEVGA